MMGRPWEVERMLRGHSSTGSFCTRTAAPRGKQSRETAVAERHMRIAGGTEHMGSVPKKRWAKVHPTGAPLPPSFPASATYLASEVQENLRPSAAQSQEPLPGSGTAHAPRHSPPQCTAANSEVSPRPPAAPFQAEPSRRHLPKPEGRLRTGGSGAPPAD